MGISQRLGRKMQRDPRMPGARNFENYRDILIVLLQKELKVRYNNKLLGYMWSIANPLASAIVYYIAFEILMRLRIPDYQLILLTGVFPWQWFSNAVGGSSNVFVGNASIIKKVNFPRNIVPLCMVLNHMIHYIMSIPVIVVFLLFYQRTPSIAWLYGLPLWLAVHFLMVYGISLGLASINLFFRDLERLMSIVLNFAFYLTPILYPLDTIPEKVRHLIFLNPAAPLIAGWRELLLYGRVDWLFWSVSLGYAALFFTIGNLIYRRLSWKFAEVI